MSRNLLAQLLKIREMPLPDVIRILRLQNLLSSSIRCSYCAQVMSEYKNPGSIDGFRMRCMTFTCPKQKFSISIRHGSIFASCAIPLKDYWTIISCWLCNLSAKFVVEQYNQSKNTVLRIYMSLRRIVQADLENNPIQLGGQGIVCEIDETLLSHKPKYNQGRGPREQIWAFGVVDTSFHPAKGLMQIVPNRRRETLYPIIRQMCRQGSIIHSDQWAAYATIGSELGFVHRTVNHSTNFVNPVTGCHTQHIESYWNRFKRHLKSMNGMRRENLPLYISEFVWKDNNRERSLHILIGLLRCFN